MLFVDSYEWQPIDEIGMHSKILKKYIQLYVPPIFLHLHRAIRRANVNASGKPFLLPSHELEGLFPGIERREVSIAASQIHNTDDYILPLTELLTLAAISKHVQPHRIFEIGTYLGSSSLTMAMNTPSDTHVVTLDLAPSDRASHKHGLGIGGLPEFTVGLHFHGTRYEEKITQLFGNSTTFDYGPFYGSIDLVFIDADHSYDFVKRDTENAFKLVRPGGIIIWDDYVSSDRHPECDGVAHVLNHLRDAGSILRITGTRLAVYVSRH